MIDKVDSSYPLAIGTSLAFESYMPPLSKPFDEARVIPKPPFPLTAYDTLYVCVNTVIRNIMAASKGATIKVSEVVHEAIAELDFIHDYVEHHHEPMKIVFYASVPIILHKRLNVQQRYRVKKSVNTKLFETIYLKSIAGILKSDKEVVIMEDGINGKNNKAIVFSHLAMDLVNFKDFSPVHLSSHTGVVTEPDEFHKFYIPLKGKEMSIFPFNMDLLLFLGDKHLIKAAPLRLRTILYNIAIDKRWNERTTVAKIKSNIKAVDFELYESIFKTT